MNVFDAETKVFDTEIFPQHIIADMDSGNTFIVSFSKKKPLRWKLISKHTYKQEHIFK